MRQEYVYKENQKIREALALLNFNNYGTLDYKRDILMTEIIMILF